MTLRHTLLLAALLAEPNAQAVAQEVPNFGSLVGEFPAEVAAGKFVRFTAYIKTLAITGPAGYAGLWWRADAPQTSAAGSAPFKAVAFDNMHDRGPHGTTDWYKYEVYIKIPSNTKRIAFGLLQTGTGTAWFADLAIQVNGTSFTSDELDLALTTPAPKGFHTRGAGYEFDVDTKVTYKGKPAFRISKIG